MEFQSYKYFFKILSVFDFLITLVFISTVLRKEEYFKIIKKKSDIDNTS